MSFDGELGFDPDGAPRFGSALRDDVVAHGVRASAWPIVLLRSPGFRMTLILRAAFAARASFGPMGGAAAGLLAWFVRHVYGCSVATTARIAGGVIFPHPQGIVIGPNARLGPRAWIFQNVTIGGAPGREGLPTIGADARIFPGAVLAGPIRVGRNCVVGANSVVTRDVPPLSMVRPVEVEVGILPDRLRVEIKSDEPT